MTELEKQERWPTIIGMLAGNHNIPDDISTEEALKLDATETALQNPSTVGWMTNFMKSVLLTKKAKKERNETA